MHFYRDILEIIPKGMILSYQHGGLEDMHTFGQRDYLSPLNHTSRQVLTQSFLVANPTGRLSPIQKSIQSTALNLSLVYSSLALSGVNK